MNNNPRDIISPDGLLQFEFDEFEMRMSHWVCNPRITEVKSGKVLLDLWGTQWDGEVSFEDGGKVVLCFRHYPGDIPGFSVHMDPQAAIFFFEDQPEQVEPLSNLRQSLDQRHSERKQLYQQAYDSATPATLTTRISSLWQKVQLVLLLMLSLIFIIGGTWWVLSGEGGIAGGIVVLGALGALVLFIGDIKEVFRRKR